MISFGEDMGMDLNTLQGAWETNCEVRPERDWERLEGRAVVTEKKNGETKYRKETTKRIS